MATVEDIIKRAYKHVGIDDPTDAQKAHALDVLNDILDSWNAQGLFIYTYNSYTYFTLTPGKYTYTVGLPDGDFQTRRPLEIVTAYIRDSNNIDHPLEIISRERYDRIITNKLATGRPERLIYYRLYPLGKIIFDKVPAVAETFCMTVLQPLEEFSSLTDTVNLPPGYRRALRLNLAVELAVDEDVRMVETIYRDAERSKIILKEANSMPTPEVEFDRYLLWDI